MTDAELQTAFEVALQLIQHLNTALQRVGQLESLVFRKVAFFVRHLHTALEADPALCLYV